VTCHYDVEEWLQPDWVYEVPTAQFSWRELQRRPPIELEIGRVHHSAWHLFAHHHYLTHHLNRAAFCFAAFWKGRPVAFDAWLPFFGKLKGSRGARRGHRTVCLPDFQGIGIGNALFSHVAKMWIGLGFRAFSGTGHPAEIAHRLRDPNWKMTRAPGFTGAGTNHAVDRTRAVNRYTASFEWVGAGLPPADAMRLLNSRAEIA
jgi:GNAT superfamily N-acetyltransferase